MGVRRRPADLSKKSNIVLVVEDDNVELLHTELELEGFYVFTAHNGAVALTKVRAQKPHVILMDVLMPEMNGIEATKIFNELSLQQAAGYHVGSLRYADDKGAITLWMHPPCKQRGIRS